MNANAGLFHFFLLILNNQKKINAWSVVNMSKAKKEKKNIKTQKIKMKIKMQLFLKYFLHYDNHRLIFLLKRL